MYAFRRNNLSVQLKLENYICPHANLQCVQNKLLVYTKQIIQMQIINNINKYLHANIHVYNK